MQLSKYSNHDSSNQFGKYKSQTFTSFVNKLISLVLFQNMKLIFHTNEFVIDKALSQVKNTVKALLTPHITGVTRCKFSSPEVNITAKPRLLNITRFYVVISI